MQEARGRSSGGRGTDLADQLQLDAEVVGRVPLGRMKAALSIPAGHVGGDRSAEVDIGTQERRGPGQELVPEEALVFGVPVVLASRGQVALQGRDLLDHRAGVLGEPVEDEVSEERQQPTLCPGGVVGCHASSSVDGSR